MDISPSPTEEEAAAIVAALEGAWPKVGVEEAVDLAPRWRFSGRWWSKPLPARRERPF